MSNKAITWAYAQDVGSCGAKFVLVTLADFADEKNSCFPSHDLLADLTCQSRSGVMKQLHQLEELGLIKSQRRADKKGHRTSNRYVLSMAVPKRTESLKDSVLEGLEEIPKRTERPSLSGLGPQEPPRTPTEPKEGAASRAGQPKAVEQETAERAYERIGKACAFIAMRQIVKWAIHERGDLPQQVEEAVVGIYQAGKPITRQTVGQWLDGHIGNANRPPTYEERRNRGEWWV